MHRAKKPLVTELNQHLTCKLCKGYFIDATTIIECLHSFCRSCIVKYLESNKYCPVCDVQVHKTKPLLNIRTDKTLQDIVYKLVPRLFQNEVQRQRDFYLSHPEKSNLEQISEAYQHIISSDESISVTMCYYGCKESARYLRCPAAVTVGHLQKLIRAKYGLFDNHHVDILYNQDCLTPTLTLMDVAYIYSWKRKAPIELSYRIYEYTAKKPKLEFKEDVQVTNNNWKEVQLRISENGEMSIIQDEALELVNNNNYKAEIVTVVDNNKVTKKELPELKFVSTCEQSATTTSVTLTSTNTKTVFSTINSTKCSVACDSDKEKEVKNETKPETDKAPKRKAEVDTPEQPMKQQKQTILNHSIGVHNLSNNHPLKKHSLNKPESAEKIEKPEKTEETQSPRPNITKTLTNSSSSRPPTPKPATKPCYMPKPLIIIPRPSTSITNKNDKVQQSCSNSNKPPPVISTTIATPTPTSTPAPTPSATPLPLPPPPVSQPPKMIKTKPSTPIGYKTLRDPPKSWNSQIAKANINKPINDPKYNDSKNVRPAKFFKMRNNLPRYLGNPASGVKPMYQVHVSPEKDKEKAVETPPKGEIKKHSIVKIDPKTLKPISEKAPETTSLSNSSDLKINTSSVSIFNPLKLQNSPKTDRKSPKSPHSPKINTRPAAPLISKRDKLNLNFTPPNPFIPNLTSPTVSPNQFLYPSGPPGFPSYDPRVMAAYHNLLYGQRMPFPPPGLSLDLNQRKNFELAGPTSPKLGGMPQPHSPQHPPLKLPSSDQLSIQLSPRTSGSSSTTTTNSSTYKSQLSLKKSNKESSGKNEKSLQNAVEKLTQNRVKEIKNEAAVNKSPNETKTKQENKGKVETMTTTPSQESENKKEKQNEQKENKSEVVGDNQSEKDKDKKDEKVDSNSNTETAKAVEVGEDEKKEDKKR